MRFLKFFLLFVIILGNLNSISFAQETLVNALEPFRPFLGKTFKGELAESTPEKPVVDIMSALKESIAQAKEQKKPMKKATGKKPAQKKEKTVKAKKKLKPTKLEMAMQ